MSCPHRLSAFVSNRKHQTSPGYRTFYCQECNKRSNERSGTPFDDLQFPADIVLPAALWRRRYKLSFHDVAELLLQRGFEVGHETVRVWEFRFGPLVSENLRSKRRGQAGRSWYLDETCIKVNGRRRYLNRAIDREGNPPDSMLSEHRDNHAARRFLRRLLNATGQKPLRMTTDKHPAYTKAIRWIVGRKVLHRHNQYLNNRMEQSHRPVKQRYYPMLGFAKIESAGRFCNAFDELRNYLRVRATDGEQISASIRRKIFKDKWSTLMTELPA